MEKKNRRKLEWLWPFLIGLLVGMLGISITTAVMIGRDGLSLLQAKNAIEHRFVGEYDPEAQMNAMMEAMVDSLGDEWSYYMTAEEFAADRARGSGRYVGIGITVDREQKDGIYINSVNPDSPAQEAGIQAGEVIRAVEGETVTPETWQDCMDAIKGEEGSSLALEIQGEDAPPRQVELVRRSIQNVFAKAELLPDQIGLLTVTRFRTGVAEQLRQGLEELTQAGAQSLILDLRYNPGGQVDEMAAVLDQFLPEGPVFLARDVKGHEKVKTSDAACTELLLVVLVNRESYSAAEFTAAVLQETGRATVVGTQTYGKGYAQQSLKLFNDSAIHISTSSYYLPSGRSLAGVGMTPDVECALSEEDGKRLLTGKLPQTEDPQLQTAVSLLLDRF